MIRDFIIRRIYAALPFKANEDQEAAISSLATFLSSRDERPAFLLSGYAGTGKTSVVSALVKAMHELQQPCVLLAPTGRAAKVMSHYSGFQAFTIHKWIYHCHPETMEFRLGYNKAQNTLFVADEASMIDTQVLNDLIQFVFQGQGCRLLLLGDEAQLPPVGYDESPALDKPTLASYGLNMYTARLTQVARQAEQSGILLNATTLRERLEITPTPDVCYIEPSQVAETIEQSYREVGLEETLVITRSNRRTNLYNQGIRAQILWREDILQAGDRIMVSRNNYFWTLQYEDLPFLANGDMLEIVRLRNEREIYGFRFADAVLRSLDYEWEIDAVVWLDTLTTATPEESYQLQRTLYGKIAEDYPEIRSKKELRDKVTASPYYNALQIRYAYAVTCHKSQGGQWRHIIIDAGPAPEDLSEKDDLRWHYTALTRATEQVYLLKNK